MTHVAVFLLACMIDYFYVMWVRAVGEGKRLKASAASVLLALPALVGVIHVVHNITYSVPYLAGLFVGTYISVKPKED